MMEVAVVIGTDGEALHWHLPPGRTMGSIPDTRSLWDILWSNKDTLQGVAHSHPGQGAPVPSYEDVTTFAAIEGSLGRRLDWWITTQDELVLFTWTGPGRLDYIPIFRYCSDLPWLCELRRLTYTHVHVEGGSHDR